MTIKINISRSNLKSALKPLVLRPILIALSGVMVGGLLAIADSWAGQSPKSATEALPPDAERVGVISEVLVTSFPVGATSLGSFRPFGGGGGTFFKISNMSSFSPYAFSFSSHEVLDYFTDQNLNYRDSSGSSITFVLGSRDSQNLSSLVLIGLASNSPSRVDSFRCTRIGFPEGATAGNPVPAADYLVFNHWCLQVNRGAASAQVTNRGTEISRDFRALPSNDYKLRATYQDSIKIKELSFKIPETTQGID